MCNNMVRMTELESGQAGYELLGGLMLTKATMPSCLPPVREGLLFTGMSIGPTKGGLAREARGAVFLTPPLPPPPASLGFWAVLPRT